MPTFFKRNTMITTYEEALQWLYAQPRGKKRKNLDDIKIILAQLNNPHLSTRIIHVAGTNGKGSTIAFLKDILMAHGYTVATFTSPHITVFNERFQINHQMIDNDTIVKYINQLKAFDLAQFEIFTLLFFLYITDNAVDYAIVEVGIGGLMDTTNVVHPILSIITSVGFDHMDLLGETIEEIAIQKAGIIKQNIPVIIGQINDKAMQVIKQIANKQQSSYYVPQVCDVVYKRDCTTFQFNDKTYGITLLGEHQVNNAALAIQCSRLILEKKWQYELTQQAIQQTKWIGRFEKISTQPIIYLDGAHNIEGINSLVTTINRLFDVSKVQILFGALERKSYDEMLKRLSQYTLKITTFDFYGSLQKENLSEVYQSYFIENWQQEIKRWCKQSDNHIYIVTGSLYFIAQVREFMKKQHILE